MGGIGVIHNPFARGNVRRPGVVKKLKEIVSDVGELWETRNINELTQVAEAFLRQKLEVLAVNGGDGTLHLVLSAFIKVYGDHPLPKLISLRGGTMNTMSNSLNIKGKGTAILAKVVQKYQAAEPLKELKQNLLKINDKYGFMSGAGMVANFLDAYYSAPEPGPWPAIKLITKGAVSGILGTAYARRLFRPAPIRVSVDGRRLEPLEFTGIMGCTIKEVGLGLRPTFRAYDRPGHFHFIATTIKPFPFALRIPAFWFNRDWVHPKVQHSGIAREVVVEPREPIRYTMDGEMYTADQPLHFSVGPALSVVTP
jgi:diacylglycerol kinase family enzyme